MTPIIDLQPAAASRFVQGYVGAVTSAVSIAVSDDAERCCFCVFVLFFVLDLGSLEGCRSGRSGRSSGLPARRPTGPLQFPTSSSSLVAREEEEAAFTHLPEGKPKPITDPAGPPYSARAHTHACTHTHRLGHGVSAL